MRPFTKGGFWKLGPGRRCHPVLAQVIFHYPHFPELALVVFACGSTGDPQPTDGLQVEAGLATGGVHCLSIFGVIERNFSALFPLC